MTHNMRSRSLLFPLATVVLCGGIGMAQSLDGFEDIGPDGSPVVSRVVDGVTVTISTAGANTMTARTYCVPPSAFIGAGGQVNLPLKPENVTGMRFISSSTSAGDFDVDQPIVFDLSEGVSAFGITTLDLLEGPGVGPSEYVALCAFDDQDMFVAEHRRQGPQDDSGLDLVWRVTSASSNIHRVRLIGPELMNGLGYGLDDMFVRVEPLSSVEIEIAQESAPMMGDWDANVLGTVETLDYHLTPAQLYGYYPISHSYTGPDPSADGKTLLSIFRSATTSELALFVVHDLFQDGTGGHAITAVRVNGDANGANWIVYDDPSDVGVDMYVGSAGSHDFTANQDWSGPYNDGYVIGALEGGWELLVEFTADPTGIDTWVARSGDGSEILLALEPGRRVRLKRKGMGGGVVGMRYCFGDGTGIACPCGNHTAPGEGCANSTGSGAVLTGFGSPSVADDDLVVKATQVWPYQFGVIFMSDTQIEAPFGDGLQCAGGSPTGIFRFPIQNAGPAGVIEFGPGLSGYSQTNFPPTGHIHAGTTWNFQAWFRDPIGPCGSAFNLSNALNVTFGP